MPQNSRQVFRTHSNYLTAIRHVASSGVEDDKQKSLELLASKVYDSGCLQLEKEVEFNIKDIHHSLNNAWGIEALFKMGNVFIKEDDLSDSQITGALFKHITFSIIPLRHLQSLKVIQDQELMLRF